MKVRQITPIRPVIIRLWHILFAGYNNPKAGDMPHYRKELLHDPIRCFYRRPLVGIDDNYSRTRANRQIRNQAGSERSWSRRSRLFDNGRYRSNVVIPKFRPCKISTNIYRRHCSGSAKSRKAASAQSDTDPLKHCIQRWLCLEIDPRARFVSKRSFGVVGELSEQNALSALAGSANQEDALRPLAREHVLEDLQLAFPVGNLAHVLLTQRCDESPMLNLFLSPAFISRMVASVSPFTVNSFSLPRLAPDVSARVLATGRSASTLASNPCLLTFNLPPLRLRRRINTTPITATAITIAIKTFSFIELAERTGKLITNTRGIFP
jgi:hypothetical protein